MQTLREKNRKVFFYLKDAVDTYFEKNIKDIEYVDDIKQFRFTLIKKGKTFSGIQLQFINKKEKVVHIITDEDAFLKKRMENFYKFESDIDFVTTILYFFCKHYDIVFSLVSDTIFNRKIKTEVTDITKGDSSIELLKYIYLDLRPI